MKYEDKITEIFFLIDDFCIEFNNEKEFNQLSFDNSVKKRNRKSLMSESEVMTITVFYHLSQVRNFKHYYLYYVCKYLTSEFPERLSYNRFVERKSKVFILLMMFLKIFCYGECTGISFVDSTPLRVCKNKRIFNHKTFEGIAARGKSTMGFFFGFKLHLIINERGEILNFALSKGNVDDRNEDVMKTMTKDLFGKLYADKGYVSQKLFDMLFNDDINIVTGLRANMKNRIMPLMDKILLRKRSVIETVNDELKNICDIEHSRHRSPSNFIINTISGMIAYSFLPKKPSINIEWEKPNNGQLALAI